MGVPHWPEMASERTRTFRTPALLPSGFELVSSLSGGVWPRSFVPNQEVMSDVPI